MVMEVLDGLLEGRFETACSGCSLLFGRDEGSAGLGWVEVKTWQVVGRSHLLALHHCNSEMISKSGHAFNQPNKWWSGRPVGSILADRSASEACQISLWPLREGPHFRGQPTLMNPSTLLVM